MRWSVEACWPADHPALADPALRPWAEGIGEVAADLTPQRVLRYLRSRRVTTLCSSPAGELFVVKVFASPRARGNERRLSELAGRLGDVVPEPRGCDDAGHVAVIRWQHGPVFDQLDDAQFADAAAPVGRVLRALHSSGAVIDRTWSWHDETALLDRRLPATLRSELDSVRAATSHLADAALVASHRDFHPRQVVVRADGPALIDLDDAAMAPRALDLGNFVAHLLRDAAIGERSWWATNEAIARVVEGYGGADDDHELWVRLALLRLAGLAETRHDRLDWQAAIVDLLRRRQPADRLARR
jgi:Ser/Thr protein kinase RdoA (MazF antagonist)